MFHFSEDTSYLMPAHFGGLKDALAPTLYADVTGILLTYRTQLDALSRYVPEGFEVTDPQVVVGYYMARGVQWMAGSHYNLITVNAPVAWVGGRERLQGLYALVVWENKTTPILSGREWTGIPKVFSDIEDLHELGERRFTNASYEGTTFLSLDVRLAKQLSAEELKLLHRDQGRLNWFGWRYIQHTGRTGAALSHATLYPVESTFSAAWTAEGRIRWTAPTWEQNPTQAHIIRALSELPIEGYGSCLFTRGTQTLKTDRARALP